ncbi:MAG TPA: AAA family ATPase [Saprospiraceae bacterium]|nr:AAA family ATPase [Saprospiraceae bacterium]
MEYLKLENLKYFIEEADQKYDVNSAGVFFVKDTKEKLFHFINLLGHKLDQNFEITYEERPNKQPGRNRPTTLKNYILLGFVPQKYLHLAENRVFVKIELDVKNRQPKLFIEVDTNLKLGLNIFNDQRESINADTHWEIPIDNKFPNTWDQLLEKCLPAITHCLTYLDNLLTKDKLTHNLKNATHLKHPQNNQHMPPLNQILYGPPGTGKTYNTINMALDILGEETEGKPRMELKDRFDKLVKEGQIMFTTFHQSMSYEDFIEGIKPIKPSSDDEFLKYDIEDGIFKKLCLQAGRKHQTNFRAAYDQFITQAAQQGNELVEMKTPSQKIFHVNVNSNDNLNLFTGNDKTKQGVLTVEKLEKYAADYKVFKGWQGYASGVLEYLRLNFNLQVVEQADDKKYVLIIDEINRGNVSSIFGELITLIEEDKRQGKPEALEVILPYSKDKFSVPPNLYIIGTMNTADRSVEALDAALRRRFSFTEMPPNPELIAIEGKLKDENGRLGNIDLPELLNTINRRLEKLLDKDHKIGHSYFMKVASLDDLKFAFKHEIIPLLQEYFYGDIGKMGLVLGKGFVVDNAQDEENDNNAVFANFYDYESSAYSDRSVYRIEDAINMSDDIFKSAIGTLLNK